MSEQQTNCDEKIQALAESVDERFKVMLDVLASLPVMQMGSVELDADRAKLGDLSTFTQVDFPEPFAEIAPVQVFANVTSCNGADTPGLRVAAVTHTGFKVRMDELVANGKRISDGGHTKETITWLALQKLPVDSGPVIQRSGYGVLALTMK